MSGGGGHGTGKREERGWNRMSRVGKGGLHGKKGGEGKKN